MIAHNIAYNADMLPVPCVNTPTVDVQRIIRGIHPDLSVAWWSSCDVCGREHPGIMNRCPGRQMGEGDRDVEPHTKKQSISGFWAVYIQRPMYLAGYTPALGCHLCVIEHLPWYIGWIEPHRITNTFAAISRVTYPSRQDGANIKQALETGFQRLHDHAFNTYEGLVDEINYWKRLEYERRTGMPAGSYMTVTSNLHN